MTVLRAEKLPGEIQIGFDKTDQNRYFHSTNVFGTMLDDDFLEFDLTNPIQPVIRQRMTWGAAGNLGENPDGTDNLSVARAFPTRVLGTLFGKLYDVYGYNQSPRKIGADPALGNRGYVGEIAPAADLRQVATLAGFPIAINNFLNVVVSVDANIQNTLYNNVLVDMYAHRNASQPPGYIPSDPLNDNIQPPYSKHLNLQVQMDRGRERPNNSSHAWGYSGATPLGTATIDGQLWKYGHKQETLNGNNFPFISFCGWDGSQYVRTTSFNAKNMWSWVIDNWSTVLSEAASAGVSYGDVTQSSLQVSYCDGIHVGSEVLGPGEGTISFNEMSIEIENSIEPGPWKSEPQAALGNAGDTFTIDQFRATYIDPAYHSGGVGNIRNEPFIESGSFSHDWSGDTISGTIGTESGNAGLRWFHNGKAYDSPWHVDVEGTGTELRMENHRFSESQIVKGLKEVEDDRAVKDLCRDMDISEATYYSWKSKYGEVEASDIVRLKELEDENLKRLKELEDENRRLKLMYAELSLDNKE